MVIGCVKEAPAPVLEIVSGVDATTDVSVVGKFPTAVPFAFTLGLGGVDGAFVVVDETTEASSVGKREDAAADGAGEADAEAAATGDGSGDSPIVPLSRLN